MTFIGGKIFIVVDVLKVLRKNDQRLLDSCFVNHGRIFAKCLPYRLDIAEKRKHEQFYILLIVLEFVIYRHLLYDFGQFRKIFSFLRAQ